MCHTRNKIHTLPREDLFSITTENLTLCDPWAKTTRMSFSETDAMSFHSVMLCKKGNPTSGGHNSSSPGILHLNKLIQYILSERLPLLSLLTAGYGMQ